MGTGAATSAWRGSVSGYESDFTANQLLAVNTDGY